MAGQRCGGGGGGPSGGGLFCADALSVQPASADHSIQCFINFMTTPDNNAWAAIVLRALVS